MRLFLSQPFLFTPSFVTGSLVPCASQRRDCASVSTASGANELQHLGGQGAAICSACLDKGKFRESLGEKGLDSTQGIDTDQTSGKMGINRVFPQK